MLLLSATLHPFRDQVGPDGVVQRADEDRMDVLARLTTVSNLVLALVLSAVACTLRALLRSTQLRGVFVTQCRMSTSALYRLCGSRWLCRLAASTPRRPPLSFPSPQCLCRVRYPSPPPLPSDREICYIYAVCRRPYRIRIKMPSWQMENLKKK